MKNTYLIAGVVLVALLAAASAASGATITWTSNGLTDNWSEEANWDSLPPGMSDIAVFSDAGAAADDNLTNVLDPPAAEIASYTFWPVTLADGDAITVSANGAAPQTFTFAAGAYTAADIAAAITATASGFTATAPDGNLVLQASNSLQVADVVAGTAEKLGLGTDLVESIWTINGLTTTNVAGRHKTDLSGKTLVVNGNVLMADRLVCYPVTMTNGTFQVGTPDQARNLTIGWSDWNQVQGQASLVVTDATFRGYLNNVSIPANYTWNPATDCSLDLSNATVDGGVFKAANLTVGCGGGRGFLSLPANLAELAVTNYLILSTMNGIGKIGVAPGYSLPGDMNVTLGVWDTTRCDVNMAVNQGVLDATFVASSGGTFTGYLGTVEMSQQFTPGWVSTSTIDLRNMTSANIDVQNLNISNYANPNTCTQRAYVYLPAGEVSAATTRVCNATNDHASTSGLLQLHGTHYAVASGGTLNVGPRGTVKVVLTGTSGGVDIAADATFVLNGRMDIDFGSGMPEEGIYWGLRWAGNHENELWALRASGKLTGWDSGLGGPVWGIMYDDASQATYVTVKESWPPKAVPKDRTFEVAEGAATVVFAAVDLDNGSFDPMGGSIVSISIDSPDDQDASPDTVTLNQLGPHVVNLTVVNDSDVQATSPCTITLAEIAAGVETGLTWTGQAGSSMMERKEWSWGTNWSGSAPPAEPTAGALTFANACVMQDDTVTNILDSDRTIGGFTVNATTGNHRTDLAGRRLIIAGPVAIGKSEVTKTTRIGNGALEIGTDAVHRDVQIGGLGHWSNPVSQGSLIVSGGTFTTHLATFMLGASQSGGQYDYGTLDLLETTVGAFRADSIILGAQGEGRIKVGAASGLTEIAIRNSAVIGQVSGIARFGDPASLPAYTLPAGTNLTFGEWGATRCNVAIGQTTGGYDMKADGQIIASDGGTCSAYLGNLVLAWHQGSDAPWAPNGYAIGMLDLTAMDSVTIDATRIEVAAAPLLAAPTVTRYNDGRGYLYLPAGTVTAGTVLVAHPDVATANCDATMEAIMKLYGTNLSAGSFTVGPRGTVTTYVKGASCGVEVGEGGTFDLRGNMNIIFEVPPTQAGVYYGLKLAGDKVADLVALNEAGQLTWDDTSLTAPVSIFTQGGFTYVGQSVALAKVTSFTVADSTSGSSLITNQAAVTVAITGESAEGQTIVGYAVTESETEPTSWLGAITGYSIQALSGADVTLYGWVKDSAGNVAYASATIYYNSAAPVITAGPTVTNNGDSTATAVWTTDIPALGSINYGPATLAGTTPGSAAELAVGTSHSVLLTGLNTATTNYKIVVVNTEVVSPAFFWPSMWPIPCDVNKDCKVNILDLIAIRNKLNQPVSGENIFADVNLPAPDGKINILDLIAVRNKLNTQCTP